MACVTVQDQCKAGDPVLKCVRMQVGDVWISGIGHVYIGGMYSSNSANRDDGFNPASEFLSNRGLFFASLSSEEGKRDLSAT